MNRSCLNCVHCTRCSDGALRCLKFLTYVPSLNKVQYADIATARKADLCGDGKYHEAARTCAQAREKRCKEDTMQVLVPCMVSDYSLQKSYVRQI